MVFPPPFVSSQTTPRLSNQCHHLPQNLHSYCRHSQHPPLGPEPTVALGLAHQEMGAWEEAYEKLQHHPQACCGGGEPS